MTVVDASSSDTTGECSGDVLSYRTAIATQRARAINFAYFALYARAINFSYFALYARVINFAYFALYARAINFAYFT